MISANIHPITLPFDHITNTTYSLFHNHIFQRMAARPDEPEPTTHPINLLQTDIHLQNTIGCPFQEKSSTTFRLLGQNINGISPRHNFNKWNEILQSTITHEVDFLCLSETNLEWQHPHVSERIATTTKHFFRHSRLMTPSSSIKFERM